MKNSLFNQLLCKLFGHSWKKEMCTVPGREIYICTRCGKETNFSIKKKLY